VTARDDREPAGQEFMGRVHREGIVPNVDAIARVFLDGDVAILFFEVGGPDPKMGPFAEQAARALGWKGGRIEVGRMTKTRAARMADAIAQSTPGDVAGIAWFRRRAGDRLYLVTQYATFCLDYAPAEGWSLAPGTTDREWKS
jgi:hypothetical protein